MTFETAPKTPTAPGRNVMRVVLTGGPCAGKTSSIKVLSEELEARGYSVYVVCEIATLLLEGGCKLAGASREKVQAFQEQVVPLQLQLENAFTTIAERSHEKSVILCDRGAIDGKCYLTDEEWDNQLAIFNLNTQELEERYDAVLFLVSAADGATEFYGTAGNEVRFETAEQACKLDERLRTCYIGSPNVRVFDNSVDIKRKTSRVLNYVLNILGAEVDEDETLQQYKLASVPSSLATQHTTENVVTTFLKGSDENKQVCITIRQKTDLKVLTCDHIQLKNGKYHCTSSHISEAEYATKLEKADPQCKPVVTTVSYFMNDKTSCKLVEMDGMDTAYLFCHKSPQTIPSCSFLPEVTENVTANPAHSMFHYAQNLTN
eukprot:TRINITY_DN67402_c7_g1_i1.p1 TRINITY_DN67402_c7_g1~~TRINITY_DN67402_c7_g1_i1.p1  ORF type:complete len:391 (+),score=49.42 TRINITY_DN67402_c7_g1_i1:46-1173(+)